MTASPNVSLQFLLWSESTLVWSFCAYGASLDPLRGGDERDSWVRWTMLVLCRGLLAGGLAYLLSHSAGLAGFLLFTVALQPVFRFLLPVHLVPEFEVCWVGLSIFLIHLTIEHYVLAPRWVPRSLAPPHVALLCLAACILFVVVRGGTYIVRGVLRKSGAVPSLRQPALPSGPEGHAVSIAASVAAKAVIDISEYNRGRLIGNLERIVLTIVVAAGSYAALAFLVAAKGVVRFDEIEKSRDFAEYFLIGSLCSVLVALCAGLLLRLALLHLWPDLIGLQIQ